MFDHSTSPSRPRRVARLLHARARCARPRRRLARVGRLRDHAGRRRPSAGEGAAHRLRRREPRGGRRVVAEAGRRGLPERRRARPAAGVQRDLLRWLRPRPGRQLGRGRAPLPQPHRRDRPRLAPDGRPRGDEGVLRDGRTRGRDRARPRDARARSLLRRRGLVHVRRGRRRPSMSTSPSACRAPTRSRRST